MVWANVDKPTKIFTIHSSEKCRFVIGKHETSLKGIQTMKDDGCWKSFNNMNEARDFYQEKYSKYALIEHC